MNRKSLIALLSNKPNVSWLKSKDHENKEMKWVYVCPFLKKDWKIGISENGYWCINYEDHIGEVIEEKDGFRFVVLLDSTFDEVYKTLLLGLRQANLPDNVIFTFPFDEILLSALLSTWSHKALIWINKGYPVTERMMLAICKDDKQEPFYLKWKKDRFRKIFGI